MVTFGGVDKALANRRLFYFLNHFRRECFKIIRVLADIVGVNTHQHFILAENVIKQYLLRFFKDARKHEPALSLFNFVTAIILN